MKQILTVILLTLIAVPCISSAGEVQQTAMDKLIEGYQVNKRAVEPEDKDAELIRLRSQMIDLRVERDRLEDEVGFLKNRAANIEAMGEHPECLDVKCVPVTEVEQDKIITYVIYTLGQYRLAELMETSLPLEEVDAHNMARKIMEGARNNLNVLGFDTSDMGEYPTLDELMEQWTVSQGSRTAQ